MTLLVGDYDRGKIREGGEEMFIGKVLKERMNYFDISKEVLSEEALVDLKELDSILNNEISYDQIDEISLEFISKVLYCKPEYFIDQSIRCKDLVHACYNRGQSAPESNRVKGILQNFAEDLAFLCELECDKLSRRGENISG